MVTKEEWVDWRRDHVTLELLRGLYQKREAIKEGIAEGEPTDDKEMYIAMGRAQALKDTIKYITEHFDYVEIEVKDGTESGSV